MRSKISFDQNDVVLQYKDKYGEDFERIFTCPTSGGYVRENGSQVCDRLARIGNTLRCVSPADFIATIRREYQKMKHDDVKA